MNETHITFSQNFANRFLEIYPKLKAEEDFIKIGGISGNFTAKVMDFHIGIPKSRFMELCEVGDMAEKIWTDLTKPTHKRILETLVTNFIREKAALHDCVFFKALPDQLNIYLRHSSKVITQQPQNFPPLFYESFDQLHEVIQGEYAITTANSKKPVIATWHMADCVCFVAFNIFRKIGIVAHIDTYADVPDFFEKLKKNIDPVQNESLEFDYVLIGGASGSSHDHRGNIQQIAEKSNDLYIKFRFIQNSNQLLPAELLAKDSGWCVSMRLNRSVALDTRQDTLSNALKAYEPDLNINSSLHKRDGTLHEASAFEKKREHEKVLSLSYNGLAS